MDNSTNQLPIRQSAVGEFAQCRRAHYFKYDLNLVPHRVNFTIFRGTMVAKWQEVFFGGGSFEEADAAITKLIDEHPDMSSASAEEINDALALADDVFAQMRRYCEFWAVDVKKIIAVELPLVLHLGGGLPDVSVTIDRIEEVPGHGIVLWDTKAVKTGRDDSYLEFDQQLLTYAAAAKEAGFTIDCIGLDQIKPSPKKPKQNLNGSMSRQAVGDWLTYRRTLEEVGLNPDDYQDMEEKLPLCSEFHRYVVPVTDTMCANMKHEVTMRVKEMVDPSKKIYTTSDRMKCARCAFMEVCIEAMAGRPYQELLESSFHKAQPFEENGEE